MSINKDIRDEIDDEYIKENKIFNEFSKDNEKKWRSVVIQKYQRFLSIAI